MPAATTFPYTPAADRAALHRICEGRYADPVEKWPLHVRGRLMLAGLVLSWGGLIALIVAVQP